MYNRRLLLCMLIALFILTLSACTTTTPPTTTLPSSTSASDSTLLVPPPQSTDKGNVTGRLFQIKPQGDTIPLGSVTVYLGTIRGSATGKDMAVTLDRISAPKVVTNDQGNFVFTNIMPGRYGLMVDTPTGAALLNNPDNGGDFIVEVIGGKTVNLGDLKYPLVY